MRSRRAWSAGAPAPRGACRSGAAGVARAAPGARAAEDLDPRGGQLDGQRQPVQPAADLGRVPGVGWVSRNSMWTASARSTKSRTASDATIWSNVHVSRSTGRGSGGTANSCSPETRSAARLVMSSVRAGQAASSRTRSGPAASRCSTLSRTSSNSVEAICSVRSRRIPPGCDSPMPRVRAIAGSTRSGDSSDASGTKRAPAAKPSAISRATSIASRVLPTPPGPVTVRSRTSRRASNARSPASSRSRPTNAVKGAGRNRSAAVGDDELMWSPIAEHTRAHPLIIRDARQRVCEPARQNATEEHAGNL